MGIKCPKCGEGEILMRKAKQGRSFYGCTKYPNCDFISNALPVMQPCTECESKFLVKKSTKKDGDFLECPVCKARYPINENKEEKAQVAE